MIIYTMAQIVRLFSATLPTVAFSQSIGYYPIHPNTVTADVVAKTTLPQSQVSSQEVFSKK